MSATTEKTSRARGRIRIEPGAKRVRAKIAGLVAFYNEKVDLYVDCVRQERPSTKFS